MRRAATPSLPPGSGPVGPDGPPPTASWLRLRCRPAAAFHLGCACLLGVVGCGGAPLLHPAQALPPGVVRASVGVSAQAALVGASVPVGDAKGQPDERTLHDLAIAPGVSPFVGARVGLRGDNEGGLAYTGRAVRVDGRHAFDLGGSALSIGVGGTMILPERPGEDAEVRGVYGGGVDLPILWGVESQSGLYALWLGPRGGVDVLGGHVQVNGPSGSDLERGDVSAKHYWVGGVLGVRAGFRHVHGALELGLAYHRAEGTLAGRSLATKDLTLAPAGALQLTF